MMNIMSLLSKRKSSKEINVKEIPETELPGKVKEIVEGIEATLASNIDKYTSEKGSAELRIGHCYQTTDGQAYTISGTFIKYGQNGRQIGTDVVILEVKYDGGNLIEYTETWNDAYSIRAQVIDPAIVPLEDLTDEPWISDVDLKDRQIRFMEEYHGDKATKSYLQAKVNRRIPNADVIEFSDGNASLADIRCDVTFIFPMKNGKTQCHYEMTEGMPTYRKGDGVDAAILAFGGYGGIENTIEDIAERSPEMWRELGIHSLKRA